MARLAGTHPAGGSLPVAALPSAPSVAYAEGDALGGREETACAPDVERIRRGVDIHAHDARVAYTPVDDRLGKGGEPILGVAGRGQALDRDDAYARHFCSKCARGVCFRASADEIEQEIVGELVVRARIVGKDPRTFNLVVADKSGPAATRS